jgi:hypothetical protein
MRTAYDALRKAIVKDYGWWYKREWPTLPEDVRERIVGGVAYNHFGNPLLTNLSHQYINRAEGVIRGKQSAVWSIEPEYEKNLVKLKAFFPFHWFVFCSFSFDDWFELKGFKSKSAAIAYYKKQLKRADGIFYTFWFKW